MLSKAGSLNSGVGATGTTQEITIGFEAKVIFFWWNGTTGTSDYVAGATHHRGFGVATSPSARYCFDTRSVDAQANSVGSSYIHNAACIIAHTDTILDGAIDILTIGATSFTLTIDDVMPYDLRVHYLALGGNDVVNATCGTVAADASLRFVVSGLGWQPNFAMLLSNNAFTAAPAGIATDSTFSLGIATSSTNQVVLAAGEDDASATTDTASYNTDNKFYGALSSAIGTTITLGVDFTSFDSGGFTTTADTGFGAGKIAIYVALNCTNVVVGNSLTQTDTTTDITVSGLGWKPAAGMVLSHCRAKNTTTTLTRTDKTSIGAFTSDTERIAHGVRDEDNVADSNVAIAVEHDEVYVHISDTNDTVEGLMDVKSVDAGGVTFIMDDADPAQAFFGYVLFGPAESTGETKSLTDTSTGIDDQAIAASLGLTEGALGGDFLDISSALQVTDISSALDSVLKGLRLSISEFGIGSDAVANVLNSLSVSDVGYGQSIGFHIPTFMQSKKTYGTSVDLGITFDNAISQGSLIVVACNTWSASASVTGTTDNLGNVYTKIDGTINGYFNNNAQLDTYYAYNVNGGPCTITVHSNNPTSLSIFIAEYSGFGADDPLDKNTAANGSVTDTPDSGYTDPISQSTELLFGHLFGNWGSTIGFQEGAGYTLREKYEDGASFIAGGIEDRNVFSLGSYNATFFAPSNVPNWACRIVTFKPTQEEISPITISVSLTVTDVSIENDTLIISAYLSVPDAGSGLDQITILAEAITKIINDLGSAIDNLSIQAQLSLFEISSGGDTVSLQIQFSVGDSGVGVDTSELAASLGITDSALGGDFIDLLVLAMLADSGTGTDITTLSAVLSLFDVGIGNEALTLSASLAVSDTGLGTDAISVLTAAIVLVQEIASALDNVNIQAQLSTTETASGQDAVNLQIAFSLIDSSTGIDSPEVSASLGITDGALGGDFLDLFAGLNVAEIGVGADTLSQLLASLSLSESGSASDLLQLLASLSVSDTGSGSDSITLITEILRTIADAGLGSDQISISANLSLQDVGTGQDALVIQVSLQVLDTALGTDAISILVFTLKEITDLAFGIDGTDIAASLNIGETSYGIDDPAILALLGLLDSGAGLDTPDISASLTITDTSSAADIISILQATLVLISDAGAGLDAITSITASIPVGESGLGSDQIGQILAALLVTDFGSGVDVVIKYDSTTNILRITFELNKPRIKFGIKQPAIEIKLKKRN